MCTQYTFPRIARITVLTVGPSDCSLKLHPSCNCLSSPYMCLLCKCICQIICSVILLVSACIFILILLKFLIRIWIILRQRAQDMLLICHFQYTLHDTAIVDPRS